MKSSPPRRSETEVKQKGGWKPQHCSAFTLIELVIAIAIIGVLSVILATRFTQGISRAKFENQVVGVVRILEEARAYSLSNYLVNDTEPTEYYLLAITETGATLEAYGETEVETLSSFTLNDEFEISEPYDIYYYPPYGEICITSCGNGITEVDFDLDDYTGGNQAVFVVSIYGGYPEVTY